MSEEQSKKLSYEEFRNIFVETATSYWMKTNGLDMSDPKTSPYELDESDPGSQVSSWKDISSDAFDLFIETLAQIQNSGFEVDFFQGVSEEETSEDLLSDYLQDNFGNGVKGFSDSVQSPERRAITKSSAIFVFLQTPPGDPTYVSDVREWLAEVDSLKIPDSTEVEGELFVTLDSDILGGERSECLTCGNGDDVLMTLHECKGE
jgi:hypothetical protein